METSRKKGSLVTFVTIEDGKKKKNLKSIHKQFRIGARNNSDAFNFNGFIFFARPILLKSSSASVGRALSLF
jgi:hypothetical protein